MILNIMKFIAFCAITAGLLWLLDVRVGEIVRSAVIQGYDIGLTDCQKRGGHLPNGDTT